MPEVTASIACLEPISNMAAPVPDPDLKSFRLPVDIMLVSREPVLMTSCRFSSKSSGMRSLPVFMFLNPNQMTGPMSTTTMPVTNWK